MTETQSQKEAAFWLAHDRIMGDATKPQGVEQTSFACTSPSKTFTPGNPYPKLGTVLDEVA